MLSQGEQVNGFHGVPLILMFRRVRGIDECRGVSADFKVVVVSENNKNWKIFPSRSCIALNFTHRMISNFLVNRKLNGFNSESIYEFSSTFLPNTYKEGNNSNILFKYERNLNSLMWKYLLPRKDSLFSFLWGFKIHL